MVVEDSLERYELKVEPEQNCAQILIRTCSNFTLKRAQDIIEQLGIQVLKSKRFSSNMVLMKLDTKDMRSVVLKLIENGYIEVKGFNALSFKI
jgi:hypothetical protein